MCDSDSVPGIVRRVHHKFIDNNLELNGAGHNIEYIINQ